MLSLQSASAQQRPLREDIQRIYNFRPHLLTDQQRSDKSALMDQFWEKVKSGKRSLLPALRIELADSANSGFFFYDGSLLLLSLSDTAEDRRLALAAISKCDLLDVQANSYFEQVHRIAALGEDTSPAALHILDNAAFKVFVPQHALTLGQDYALVYMLLPEDANFWIGPAIERLRVETDQIAQKSLLLLLWYAQNPDGDKALSEFVADKSRPDAVRTYAKDLLGRKAELSITSRAKALVQSEAGIRELRRQRMKSVSDEALYDLDEYTMQLIAKRR